ncbi:antibiotic biosynthesis monooxygenase family protein [Thalassotalea atypica]|uniref:antibiotic biosynthesis monooxygenase family protein n=1 Tax=Thalassotalea atypica TaxID=2054316 RepID=UPI002572CC01|nr:antibiotic biosynthesis monooxygenase family protein [Thalassotalea atypica]
MKSILSAIALLFVILCATAEEAKIQNDTTVKFGMQAVITATEGKGDELADIMHQASKAIAEIDGCILYLVQQSLTDPSKILITEVWINQASHAASLKNSEVRALIMKAKPIIIEMEHHFAKYIGDHGLYGASKSTE